MIRFIIKSVFWLSLAFIVMPKIMNSDTDRVERQNVEITLPSKDNIDDIITASQTAAEVGSFCFNNPSLCVQGKNMLSVAGSGMLDGSGKLLDFLSGQFATEKAEKTPAPAETVQSARPSSEKTVPLPRHRPQ